MYASSSQRPAASEPVLIQDNQVCLAISAVAHLAQLLHWLFHTSSLLSILLSWSAG